MKLPWEEVDPQMKRAVVHDLGTTYTFQVHYSLIVRNWIGQVWTNSCLTKDAAAKDSQAQAEEFCLGLADQYLADAVAAGRYDPENPVVARVKEKKR